MLQQASGVGSPQWSETGDQQVATKCILRCVALLVFVCASLCGKRSPCSIVASDYRRSHRGITTRCTVNIVALSTRRHPHKDFKVMDQNSLWRSYSGQWAWQGSPTNKQPTGHALLGCTCHTQFASFQLENTLTVPTLPPLFSSFSLSLALFSGNVRLHLFSKLQIFNQLQGVIFALQISFTHFSRFN